MSTFISLFRFEGGSMAADRNNKQKMPSGGNTRMAFDERVAIWLLYPIYQLWGNSENSKMPPHRDRRWQEQLTILPTSVRSTPEFCMLGPIRTCHYWQSGYCN